jgi:MFS family permease
MNAITPTISPGRRQLWFGLLAAILGVAIYMGLFLGAGHLHMPWYTLASAVVGLMLVLLSLKHKRTAWRFLALFFVGALVALEGWFLLSYIRNPAYAGPLSPGRPFPAFTAKHTTGQPFTQADLTDDKDTVLIFYRGHW